ncbi:MAG TPA: ATP-dependent Clp protease adaptor ClpS [Opitutaceae bacterium]|jgi:ATP-dependent Clp protease adaptor protein ClpS|nr:MAG: ATP-dependent Clp protease adaptor protein ClpS [Verrucomicrobia bacterium ADurb.Bin122]HNW41823.1 ATP-dependent Clp protease adaptor ClpS [Opitutaceae bacterium]HOD46194.1 ATP-dependent Clp protease adaptor ClpS [Opitutaceae bacterium]HOF09605.1 ATP-dependent Clp protease adaptor ClpS [Opitutaceae bacterium]HOG94080.1 ATP-dependent Clp protease adaptor ClpS [Opitutaceae bacterium]
MADHPANSSVARWRVVVHDDPVNLMPYVALALRRVLGCDETEARRHVRAVCEQGCAPVGVECRENAEAQVLALQRWHLTASMEPDETA